MIKIFYSDISFFFRYEITDREVQGITSDRAQAILRFRQNQDRVRSLFSELLLLKGMNSFFLHSSFCSITKMFSLNIIRDDFGKPFFKDAHHMHFNLSHCGNYVSAAISDTEVGIDVERFVSDDGLDYVIRSFSRQEQNFLSKFDRIERAKYTARIWTLKECYAKYLGKGLLVDFSSFSVLGMIADTKADDIIDTLYTVRAEEALLHFYSVMLDHESYLSICTPLQDAIFLTCISADDLWQQHINKHSLY